MENSTKVAEPPTTFNFSHALNCLKHGEKVARAGWNGKGMWLILIGGGDWDVATVPYKEKNMLPWVGMNTVQNQFVPWFCSQTDMLAEDWEIVSDN